MDPDPVIDFKIMEAVAAKVTQEQQKATEEAEKQQKIKDWKGRTEDELGKFA